MLNPDPELVETRSAQEATGVNDGDVAALTIEGFDEEAVFEAIVAAALGASLVRLEEIARDRRRVFELTPGEVCRGPAEV